MKLVIVTAIAASFIVTTLVCMSLLDDSSGAPNLWALLGAHFVLGLVSGRHFLLPTVLSWLGSCVGIVLVMAVVTRALMQPTVAGPAFLVLGGVALVAAGLGAGAQVLVSGIETSRDREASRSVEEPKGSDSSREEDKP